MGHPPMFQVFRRSGATGNAYWMGVMNQTTPHRRRGSSIVTFAAAALWAGSAAFGASTGSTNLYMPNGSGTPTSSGDFVASNNPVAPTTGLNTFYRYFIEVPPSLARLRVQIFDADVGVGGTAEATAGRDRDRGGGVFTTTARYNLIDPNGKVRPPIFGIGNSGTPQAADGAWLSYFDGTGAGTGNFVADYFLNGAVYTDNDGNNNWVGNWTEANDGTNVATGGKIQVASNALRVGAAAGATASVFREVNLSATGLNLTAAAATLHLQFHKTGALVAGDTLVVEVSGNGGTTYAVLDTIIGTAANTAKTYALGTNAVNTRVRFRVTGGLTTANAFFFFDNIVISDGGGALTAGHWELRVDESSAVTTGSDINAIGLRVDDGDETAAGTEIPAYIDSQNEYGVNPPASGQVGRSTTNYPYFTSGCTALVNDFDYDSNQTDDVGAIAFTSRTGATTQTVSNNSLSQNNVWAQNTVNGWTTDPSATDYGLWAMVTTINSYNDATTGINGNYTTTYVGNSSLTAPPPAANPVTNGFRIYLPADGGATAPVKPYVEQFVRYRKGPNPPVVGLTQLDMVTIRVTNPTAKAITFSATNVVTATIPAANVVYSGNPQKTQGTVLTAPAIGGTGNITWNPGSVAGGATVLLSYDVTITPTSAGQRIPVVGTVASGNGTKAVWLDETGNAGQARATFTFGPLCEVAINQGMLTEAVVSALTGVPADGGLALEWQTASEAGTIGFDLYRKAPDGHWLKVNRSLLLGLLQAPQGGTYRFLDEGASPRDEQTYLLVEIDAKGNRRSHGPFLVRADWNRGSAGRDTAYERTAHAAVRKSGDDAGLQKSPKAVVSGPADALHVAVRESGLYYLASTDLAPRFGLPLANMEKVLGDGKLALSKGGQPVAWYPDMDSKNKTGKGLFFYGEALSSLYSRDNVYRLERGTGLLMSLAGAGAPSGTAPASFAAALHAEQDVLPATVLPLDPESDYWFWDGLLAGDPTNGAKSFTLDAPGAVTAGGAIGTGTLTVHLQGASASGLPAEHHPAVSLNGTALGEAHFEGISPFAATFSFAPSLLTPTGNQVQVTGLLDAGIPYSLFYIDSFDLSYPRSFRAASGALAFTGAAGPVQVAGFGDPAVRLLDLSIPARPRWLSGAAVSADPQGGFALAFQSPIPTAYLASASAGLKTPVALTPFRTPRLRVTTNHADLVVLAGAGLHDAAQRLADYRASQGLDSMVVDLDEVTDEFAFGLPDPHAIPAFLAYTRSAWRTAPRYLVLAGAGTVDYRDLLGFGGNPLPPLFISTDDGIFPSDGRLGDLVADDGLPELAVGRIPAHTAAELNAYVDKIIAYETGPDGGWVGSAIALADAPDRGANFVTGSEQVAGYLSGYNVDRIYLGSTTIEDARSRLLHDLAAGASIVDYNGHGGLDRLASGGLLASSDVASLGNGARLPVLTAMTCTVNRFAVPGFSSLGELLVNQAAGGAVAVWAPSGLSIHFEADLLAQRFYRHLGDTDGARLGDMVLRALQDFQTQGGSKAMLQIYNLLGDPALRLRRPNFGPAGPSGPDRE